MKTEYQYFKFAELPHKTKTGVWYCINLRSDEVLGRVKWYAPWRTYIFESAVTALERGIAGMEFCGVIFNNTCLADIRHFIGQLMEARSNPHPFNPPE